MGRIAVNPRLNYKDTCDMYVVNSHQKAPDSPIMSFQTNKNGTFNPSLTIAAGVLKWVIGGAEYNTNSPSVTLTGELVDVEVYAGTVLEGEIVNDVTMNGLNILGSLDFSWFLLQGDIKTYLNVGLNSLILRNAENIISLRCYDCNIITLDLTHARISGDIYAYRNVNLSTMLFSDYANSSGNFRVMNTALATINLSKIEIETICNLANNTSCTSLIFNTTQKRVRDLSVTNCQITSLDISHFTFYGIHTISNNLSLTSITLPYGYETGIFGINFSNNALTLDTVNGWLSALNVFFSANPPTRDLFVNIGGGTNASPTGGVNNTDILNLVSVFNAAGFTFTFTIN